MSSFKLKSAKDPDVSVRQRIHQIYTGLVAQAAQASGLPPGTQLDPLMACAMRIEAHELFLAEIIEPSPIVKLT